MLGLGDPLICSILERFFCFCPPEKLLYHVGQHQSGREGGREELWQLPRDADRLCRRGRAGGDGLPAVQGGGHGELGGAEGQASPCLLAWGPAYLWPCLCKAALLFSGQDTPTSPRWAMGTPWAAAEDHVTWQYPLQHLIYPNPYFPCDGRDPVTEILAVLCSIYPRVLHGGNKCDGGHRTEHHRCFFQHDPRL